MKKIDVIQKIIDLLIKITQKTMKSSSNCSVRKVYKETIWAFNLDFINKIDPKHLISEFVKNFEDINNGAGELNILPIGLCTADGIMDLTSQALDGLRLNFKDKVVHTVGDGWVPDCPNIKLKHENRMPFKTCGCTKKWWDDKFNVPSTFNKNLSKLGNGITNSVIFWTRGYYWRGDQRRVKKFLCNLGYNKYPIDLWSITHFEAAGEYVVVFEYEKD